KDWSLFLSSARHHVLWAERCPSFSACPSPYGMLMSPARALARQGPGPRPALEYLWVFRHSSAVVVLGVEPGRVVLRHGCPRAWAQPAIYRNCEAAEGIHSYPAFC